MWRFPWYSFFSNFTTLLVNGKATFFFWQLLEPQLYQFGGLPFLATLPLQSSLCFGHLQRNPFIDLEYSADEVCMCMCMCKSSGQCSLFRIGNVWYFLGRGQYNLRPKTLLRDEITRFITKILVHIWLWLWTALNGVLDWSRIRIHVQITSNFTQSLQACTGVQLFVIFLTSVTIQRSYRLQHRKG